MQTNYIENLGLSYFAVLSLYRHFLAIHVGITLIP